MLPPFSVIVPAYNEAHRIGGTVQEILDYLQAARADAELIVVNDGSTDATSDVVREIFARSPQVPARLIEECPNHGKGFAVRSGIMASTRRIALFSDADLSTPISEAPKLLEPISSGEVDITFGSRALDRRLIGNRQPWRREQAGRVFNLLVRLSTGLPFWDTQCGFKAFRLDVCEPLFQQARVNGFSFDVELLYLAQRLGLRMREIPVRWNHHEGSKVHFVHDSLRMLGEVISLRTHRGYAKTARN